MASYFITSEEDPQPSAIEIAQAKRVKLFNSYGQKAKIVELNYNYFHRASRMALNTEDQVINIFQYFQNLQYEADPAIDRIIINRLLNTNGYEVRSNAAYQNGKLRIQAILANNRLHSVCYYDQFNFLDRKDYYDEGKLSFTEFYEDKGRVVLKQFYDNQSFPIILFHYRGGENNVPILSLIQLFYRGKWHEFDSMVDFRAYFLDDLAQSDLHSVFFGDRSDYTLAPFKIMHQPVPRYLIFHSTVTLNSRIDGEVFDAYKGIGTMLKEGTLNGLISSTNEEADDVATIFETNHSYAIPVTYTDDKIKKVSFATRKPYSLIAVARLDSVKQLDHIIKAVEQLHRSNSQITLTFYGLSSSSADMTTGPALKKLVAKLNAQNYIFFGGFIKDLTQVYNSAWIEILTSKYEGFAMALLEAQEHGCPAVAYDVNYGPNEIIQNGQTGNLITPNNQEQLTDMLKELLEQPSILEQYSINAYQASQKYSFNNVALAWKNFQKRENLLESE